MPEPSGIFFVPEEPSDNPRVPLIHAILYVAAYYHHRHRVLIHIPLATNILTAF